MRRKLQLLVTCALFTAVSTAAFADISVKLTNAQLTAQSEAILIGRVASAESRWIDRQLVTAVTVQITESIKGALTGSVQVLLPGGIDANRRIPIAMSVAGAPSMRQNEDVFLFLDYSSDLGGYMVSGFAQGKFSIMTDANGIRRVNQDLRGSQLVEGTGVSRGTVTMADLASFRQEIIGYLAQ
jgi:hypothetical protein